jgi:Bifunctional DNA primase/polymerase, N-terminal/AAA domain
MPSDAQPEGYGSTAEIYWEMGWRGILPLPSRAKHQPPKGFTGRRGDYPSYADLMQWIELYPKGNLCLRMPPDVVGIDVDAYGAKTGAQALAEAEKRWGPLPPTVRSTSREDGVSGIRLYRIPSGTQLAERIEFPDLGVGDIEICQQRHRYVIALPSIHPEGREYHWRGHNNEFVGIPTPDEIPELPSVWLTNLAHNDNSADFNGKPFPVREALTSGEPSPRVTDRLRQAIKELNLPGHSRHDVTLKHVMALLRLGKSGEPGVEQALHQLGEMFVALVTPDRAGGNDEAAREYRSMVVGPGAAHNLAQPGLSDWTPREPPEDFDEPRERNDQHVNEVDETPEQTWLPADLTDVLDGTWKTPQPTVGRRSDGVGLFYRGKQHTAASESEGGKSWLLLTVARDEICSGHHVAYIDFEDDRGPVVGRLLALGVNPECIRGYFHYIRPESPLTIPINRADLDAMMAEYAPTLAVVDGVTEAMTMHGLDPLDNADAAKFGRMLPRRLAKWGAAAVSIDHVTKASETRGRYSIGAVHKLNGLDGAAYVLENRKPFGVDILGVSTIRIAKDRPGQLRKHTLPNANGLPWFADLVLDSTMGGGHTEATVLEPNSDASAKRPTRIMQRVSEELAKQPDGLAQRVICDVVQGKTDTIRLALSHLIAEGYVTNRTPHKNLKPYGDDEEA